MKRSKNVGPVFIFSRFLHENTHVTQYLEHVSNFNISKSENYRNKWVFTVVCKWLTREESWRRQRSSQSSSWCFYTEWRKNCVTENHSLARIRDSHFSFSLNSVTEAWLRNSCKSIWSLLNIQHIYLYLSCEIHCSVFMLILILNIQEYVLNH